MKAYEIKYKGLYLGGHTVVLAKSRKQALKMVENDKETINPQNMEVVNVYGTRTPKVLYNWNGDY